MRVLKIFGEETVGRIVERELGMSALQFLQLGMALTGNFHKKPFISTNQNYGPVLGVDKNVSDAFFRRITCGLDQLREQTFELQSYDRDWLYTWNPLEATLLIRFDPRHPDRTVCPIPRYCFRRASIGIFYDLVKASDFDNPYGNAFQAYMVKSCGRLAHPHRSPFCRKKPTTPAKIRSSELIGCCRTALAISSLKAKLSG